MCKNNFLLKKHVFFFLKELYVAITLDRTKGGIVIICNEKGGINIESHGESTVKTHFVSLDEGLTNEILSEVCLSFNLDESYNT